MDICHVHVPIIPYKNMQQNLKENHNPYMITAFNDVHKLEYVHYYIFYNKNNNYSTYELMNNLHIIVAE